MTEGGGSLTFHRSPDCEALRHGQAFVDLRGGVRAAIVAIAPKQAVTTGKLPCLQCFPELQGRLSASSAGADPSQLAPDLPRSPVAPRSTPAELYAWQVEALEAWEVNGSRGIVEAVTGTGKTRLGLVAIERAVAEGNRAVVLVPGKELQKQWYGELRRWLPAARLGLLGDGSQDDLRYLDVLVAIINSARTRRLAPPAGTLLVADECHHYASPQSVWALEDTYERRLGLTATLERWDRRETALIEYFGPVCFRIGYELALRDSVVAPFAVATVGVPMGISEESEYKKLSDQISDLIDVLVQDHGFPASPFHLFMAEVEAAAEGPWSYAQGPARALKGKIFERKDLMANSPAKIDVAPQLLPAMRVAQRTLVFTESVWAAERIAEALVAQGLRAGAVHSQLHDRDRQRVFDQFRAGTLDAVVAPRVLDEGVDVPEADLAIIVSASKTRRQMVQRMGRVLRRKEDGRLARFAVLYLCGTTEDPAGGAHEAFLSEITSVADDLDDFSLSSLEDALVFLSALDSYVPPPPPRRAGEPARAPLAAVEDDEEFDVRAVLGLAEASG